MCLLRCLQFNYRDSVPIFPWAGCLFGGMRGRSPGRSEAGLPRGSLAIMPGHPVGEQGENRGRDIIPADRLVRGANPGVWRGDILRLRGVGER